MKREKQKHPTTLNQKLLLPVSIHFRQLTREFLVFCMPTLTNKVGQKEIVNLLSNPGNHSKSEDHGHEVLKVKREELPQTW